MALTHLEFSEASRQISQDRFTLEGNPIRSTGQILQKRNYFTLSLTKKPVLPFLWMDISKLLQLDGSYTGFIEIWL